MMEKVNTSKSSEITKSQISRIFDLVQNRLTVLKKKTGIKSAPRFERTLELLSDLSSKFDGNNTALVDIDLNIMTKAILDSFSFVDIADLMKSTRSDQLPRRELSLYLNGIPFEGSVEETDADGRSRDHQFEFEVAAMLSLAGYKIVKFDDVQAVKNGITFNIQCKRIRSLSGLENNFLRAYSQLVKHKQMSDREYGIIIISLDLSLGLEWKNISNADQSDVDSEFSKFQRFINPKINAMQSKFLAMNYLGAFTISRFAVVNEFRMNVQTMLLEHYNMNIGSGRPLALFNQMITDVSNNQRVDADAWIGYKAKGEIIPFEAISK